MTAALLLAWAVLLGGGPGRIRLRAVLRYGRPNITPTQPVSDTDPLAAASAFDVLAACLASGMAVSAAAAAAAESAPPGLSALLRRASDMSALGAEAASAWSVTDAPHDAHCEALMRLARRSAESGTALAAGVATLADESRHDAADTAQAAAERAAVLIAAPLGACYLPAFLCLGIVPVVAGLAGDVLQTGLW
ncbi:type II secretion system F family protein [Mycolicibacterium sp. F2034L]|uniref:type II secretion system F family protein n=1 Tax=Mycolicibacterium sp. F2034L TaxID=2926422 RepID=UPI001FF60D14|nr:type II secretion system F family protein [Mycolicibacterium sp. F2034L]MCK0176429.1 type II secretion system F family protein [Mycolicibacterium sp. F2034L]